MRLPRVFYTILLIVGALLTGGVQTARAVDFGDLASAGGGAAVGFAVGGPIGALIGGVIGFFAGIFGVDDLAGKIVEILVRTVAGVVQLIIGLITELLFSIATGVVNYAILLTNEIQDSDVVELGFNTVLNLANMGLIVAIIAIAFLVMLRRDEAKRLLPRFIIAALLINFSFFIITNFLIIPVNEITLTLSDAANFDRNSFARIFFPDFDVGEVLATVADTFGDPGKEWIVNVGIIIVSLFFTAAFAFIGVITLFAFAGMLFVRYIALSLLIILMPIAWVAWIFPNLRIPGGNPWSVWWENFTRWLLFAPAVMFFFYLAVTAVNSNVLTTNVDAEGDPLTAGIAAVGDMIIIIGLLLGGLIVANRLSITGASYAKATIEKAGAYVRGRARREAIRAASAPIRNEKVKSGLAKFQKANIPVVGKPLKAAGRGLISAADRSEKVLMEETAKKYENVAPYRLAQMLDNKQLSTTDQAAILQVAQKKGYLWEMPAADVVDKFNRKGTWGKLGLQKLKLDISKEGLLPKAMEAIRDGRSQESINAIISEEFSAVPTKDIAGKLSPTFFDQYKEGQRHGLPEEEFEKLQTGLTQMLVQDRPDAINSARSRWPGPAQTHINTALEDYAKEGGAFEDEAFGYLGATHADRATQNIYSADPKKDVVRFSEASAKDKQAEIEQSWNRVRSSLLAAETKRIRARTDLDTAGKVAAAKEATSQLDRKGPQGVIADYQRRERSRRAGFMFGAAAPDTTPSGDESS